MSEEDLRKYIEAYISLVVDEYMTIDTAVEAIMLKVEKYK